MYRFPCGLRIFAFEDFEFLVAKFFFTCPASTCLCSISLADENMDNEKSIVAHAEQLGQTTEHSEFPLAGNDDALHGFQTDLDDLPAGYYRSSFFLGTMFAVGIGLTAAVGGFGLAAPALGLINSEIGPDPNINWVSFVYTLTLSISLLLVGRMSDLFG